MRWSRVLVLFAGAALAVGLSLAVGLGLASPPSAVAQPPVPCTATTLSITLGPAESTRGAVTAPLLFANTGSRACVIQGFPDVSYRTAPDGGAQVGRSAQRIGAPGGVVVLAPGEVASANLTMARADTIDAALCRPTPVQGLRVYPPSQRAPVFVPNSSTVCAGNPPNLQLTIETIKAGPGS